MGQYNWNGDFNVIGTIKQNGQPIGGGGADFAVLSQVVDHGDGTLEFPEYILPVRYYSADDDKDYYFDYENGFILDDSGNTAGELTTFDENKISACFTTGLGLVVNYDRLDYILGEGHLHPDKLNTYNLYHAGSGGSIPIEDLTTIPTYPEELYCESVGDTPGDSMYIDFSKGFIPSRIEFIDNYTGSQGWITFTYDASTGAFDIDESSNMYGNEWQILGDKNTSYTHSFMGFSIDAAMSGNPSNVSITGTFRYKSGDWLIEF